MFDTTNIINEEIRINVFKYNEKESVISDPPKLTPSGTRPVTIVNKTINKLRIARLEMAV